MTKHKHTPGPWWSYTCDDRVGEYIATRPETQREYYNGEQIAVIIDESRKPGSPGTANARLIAAAPDLLEALHEAIEWDGCDEDGVDAVWLRKARAAIAKAKGEAT